jgi:hypothetical protein
MVSGRSPLPKKSLKARRPVGPHRKEADEMGDYCVGMRDFYQ